MLILTQAIFLFCLTCTPALADFSGPVVSVLNGDTIEVLNGYHADRPTQRDRLPGEGPSLGQESAAGRLFPSLRDKKEM